MPKPYVFIIESPSKTDIDSDRSECVALSSSLRLGDVDNQVFTPRNRHEFDECFNSIIEQIASGIPSGNLGFPMVHFSAHGNEHGIFLTNEELITWSSLAETLVSAARKLELLDELDRMSLWLLSFSSCKGAYARKLLDTGIPAPCCALVGPTNDFDWADGLTAYISYFHLMLRKGFGISESVRNMNLAAGLSGVFQHYSASALSEVSAMSEE